MPRNIFSVPKAAWDFHKGGALAQTNHICMSSMTASFLPLHRNYKKVIFSRSKIRKKNPVDVFLDFVLFFNIGVEKFGKKSSWSSRKRFF